jgi:hypothetical protein
MVGRGYWLGVFWGWWVKTTSLKVEKNLGQNNNFGAIPP